MSKVGLAACSMLTLGLLERLGASLFGGGIGRGLTKPVPLTSSSSSAAKSTDSIMPRRDEVPDTAAATLRDACSFCGGAGASSAAGVVAKSSPRGPRGPRESSRASRVVDCAPNLRVGRDRLTGLFTAVDDVGLSFSFSCDSDVTGRAGTSQLTLRPLLLLYGQALGAASSSPCLARLLLDCDREGTSINPVNIEFPVHIFRYVPPQGESSSIV